MYKCIIQFKKSSRKRWGRYVRCTGRLLIGGAVDEHKMEIGDWTHSDPGDDRDNDRESRWSNKEEERMKEDLRTILELKIWKRR